MLASPKVRKAYERLTPEFELARELIRARTEAGLSQADIAARMGTTQSAVARLESGAQLPSLRTLMRFAKATNTRAVIKLTRQ
jgi:transcriptional regulator with XRE-family HTH domain